MESIGSQQRIQYLQCQVSHKTHDMIYVLSYLYLSNTFAFLTHDMYFVCFVVLVFILNFCLSNIDI